MKSNYFDLFVLVAGTATSGIYRVIGSLKVLAVLLKLFLEHVNVSFAVGALSSFQVLPVITEIVVNFVMSNRMTYFSPLYTSNFRRISYKIRYTKSQPFVRYFSFLKNGVFFLISQ